MGSATAVIPTLNEAASLGAVLAAIPADLVDEVIVVDGGSRDDTVAVARRGGATVVSEPRRGYGRACEAGARLARAEVVVFLDGDGSADPREIGRLVRPISLGHADLVLGSRLGDRASAAEMPWHQRAGNRFSAALIRACYGLPITDLGPFRAVQRERLRSMTLHDQTYGWPTEMIVKAARAGWRIIEVPVGWHRRTAGRSKVSGTLRGSALATAHILGTIAGHVRG